MNYEMKKFDELFHFMQKSKVKAGAGQKVGDYPFYTSSPIQNKYLDDYLFNGDSLIFGTGGNASIHYEKSFFSVSTDCLVAQPQDKEEIYTKYVYYYLSGNIRILESGFKGAGLRHISKGYISGLKIPIPYPEDKEKSLKEQKRIAAILDKADELRRKRKEASSLCDEFLKSTFIDMFGDPVTNPKGWDIVKFAKMGTLDRGRSQHRPRNAPKLLGGQYPLIQTGEVASSGGYIRSYSQTYSELGLKQSKIWKSGTLCITIAANIANTGVLTFDACFPDSVVGFIPNQFCITEYIQYWLSFLQKLIEAKAPAVAQKNINLRILRELDIPCPPYNLQQKFAKIVQKTEETKQKMLRSTQEMDNQFNALIQKAFKGEL